MPSETTGAGDVTRFTPAPRTRTSIESPTAALESPRQPAEADPAEGGPLAVGQSFGPRYHIVRLLGIGGMGAVYQAWDEALGVAVALKVIRPEATADPQAAHELERRFKQELLLARKVTHKNVVRIHDLGEIDGIKYITMSFVEGDDLSGLLRERGKLDVATALPIARGIVDGLQAAHEAGIVHRDLKPANVMVEDGRAVIMDFGIARSTGPGASAAPPGGRGAAAVAVRPRAAEMTTLGTVIGTVEYMAPEQARGEPADQRVDIYAFGLMLYDMLLGRRCATGTTTAMDDLQRRLTSTPPPARSVDPAIPEPLDRLITRCLQPDPAARFQTTTDLQQALAKLDDRGELIPEPARYGRWLIAAATLAVVLAVGGTWWLTRPKPAAKPHDPVSVVIADLENRTGDPTFDRTLEPMLKMSLEGAGFITAYDRTQIRRSLGVRPPEHLTEAAARELAVKQGLGVVVAGSVDRAGSGYRVSVNAVQAITGKPVGGGEAKAADRNQVLAVATKLATDVRRSLGDRSASDSAQRFAQDTLSSTSLDVVRDYAAAMEAQSDGRFEDARAAMGRAVKIDPNFGLAYAGMAMASQNLGQQQRAEEYIKEAVRHVDRMTERERYRTRGLFYMITSDYQACVKEYGDLIARYAADVTAHNNLALCSTKLRNLPKAIEEMRKAVSILPKRTLYRVNLALYADYAGDFATGESEAQAALELNTQLGLLPLAFSQVGSGQLDAAAATYDKFAKVNAAGASWAASGLADIAVYEGRYADAIRLLEQGAAADLAAKDQGRAASKLAELAYAQLSRGKPHDAVLAANRALQDGATAEIRFLAGRILAEAADAAGARTIAAALGSELQVAPQAYAKIIEGDVALKRGDARQAVKSLTEANTLLDTWIGRFDLGRAYLAAGAAIQADSEFDRCLKRRGEALALFLDEQPTYGYLPPVYYYLGRVREALNSPGAADSYTTYERIRAKSAEDPLLRDVRLRTRK